MYNWFMIVVYIVASEMAEAEKLGKMLLENRMAACVNILPAMKSIYRWNNQLETADEVVMLVKTQAGQYAAIEKCILENHSYETPAIFSFPVQHCSPEFEAWLNNQIN